MTRACCWLGIGAIATLAMGCPPPEPPTMPTPPSPAGSTLAVAPAPPAPPPPIDPFPVPAGEPKHQRVLSQRFQLSIPLPDRPGWLLIREKGSFLVMDHAATRSRLIARLWQESELMSRQRCEEVTRLIRDVPRADRVIDERIVEVPEGFDTAVTVGFSPGPPSRDAAPPPMAGHVLAFGASARWCFTFAYTTEAEGPGAERTVGDRLAVIQGLTLEGLERRLTTDIDAR